MQGPTEQTFNWDGGRPARVDYTVTVPEPAGGAGMARVRFLLQRTADRVGYLCHPDGTADPVRRPPASLWAPAIATAEGLAATAAWYRAHGLL